MVSIVQCAFFLAFILVIASSFFLTSLLKIKGIVPYLLTIYLITSANIIFTGEIAGLSHQLNNRFFFLFIHLLILAVSFFIWRKLGKPSLFAPLVSLYRPIKSVANWDSVKKHPLLVLLGIGVGLSYLLAMILILVVPPNNYDSMTCHMTRIGYWLQNGNFLPWPTWFTLQVDYPINAQIEILWSVLFWRSDTFAGFAEWFAAIFSIIAVYGIARLTNRRRSQALFACFIYSLFPQILLQSTSTMNHLLGSALVIISVYFVFLSTKLNQKIFLILAGLAIGLAIGVHLIVIILVPGYALTILFIAFKYRKKQQRIIQWFVVSAFISFTLFSSYMFIQNYYFWRQPLGRSAAANPWSLQTSDEIVKKNSYWQPKNILKYTFYNLSKYVFASYDLTGIPNDLAEPLYTLRDNIAIPFFEQTGNPTHLGEFDIDARVPAVSENWAWFGMVSFVLFFPLITIGIIESIRKKDEITGTLIFNILFYALVWSAFLARENGWSMYSGRYFVPTAMFFAPLIAIVYQKNWWSKILCGFLVVASCVIAYQTMLNNYAKPLKDSPSIFTWNRADKIYAVSRDQQPVYRAVDAYVPRGRLGIMLTASLMEYPYFGEYFHRTLIPIYPYENVNDKEWLEDQQINWILSCVDIEETPEDFEIVEKIILDPPIGISDNCVIYKRQ